MTSQCISSCARFEGTSALKIDSRPKFTVIEGGRASRTNEARASGLSLGQTLLFMVLVSLATIVLCLAGVLGEARADASAARALESAAERSTVVQPGDSLWSISSEFAIEGASTSDVVSWIERRNGLDDSCLRVGQRLLVPEPSER